MEIINEAFESFKKNGFVKLEHVIAINNEIDQFDLCNLYEIMKNNKDLIHFMDHFQVHYSTSTFSKIYLGKIGLGECIICLDEEVVCYKTHCNHFMCIKCYSSLFEGYEYKNCPYCRKMMIFDHRMIEIINKTNQEVMDEVERQEDLINAEEFYINEQEFDEEEFDEDEDQGQDLPSNASIINHIRRLMGEDLRYEEYLVQLESRL